MPMRGRLPVGPEYVDKLQGSALAKERVKAVLQTLSGDVRLQDACQELGLCEQRLHQLRQEALQAAVAALEAGPRGRPPHNPSPADERIRALEDQVAALQIELHAARVRAEIGLTLRPLPVVSGTSEKKSRGRPRKKRPPPGTRTNT
jgi:hypothetical protein